MFQFLSAPLRHPRTGLAMAGVVSGIAFVTGASAAECVNGYRTLGNGVIVACQVDVAADARASFVPDGRIAGTPDAPGANRSMIADSVSDCQPGRYRVIQWEDDDMLLAC